MRMLRPHSPSWYAPMASNLSQIVGAHVFPRMRAYNNSVVPSGGSFLELWIDPATLLSGVAGRTYMERNPRTARSNPKP